MRADWPAALDSRGLTRVCLRRARVWPGVEGHVWAYFVDCVDHSTGMILACDLSVGDSACEKVPIATARKPWTDACEAGAVAWGVEELGYRGVKVKIVRNVS